MPMLLLAGAALLLAGALLGWLRRCRAWRRRAAERERVSRDLHDTLLQGATGLVLNFQVVLNRLPVDSADRLSMQTLLDDAGRSVDEARARVSGLRSETDEGGNSA